MTATKNAMQISDVNGTRYKAIVENGPYAVALLDRTGKIQYSSGSYQQVLGYSKDELNDIDVFHTVHPDDISYTREKFQESLNNPGKSISGISYRAMHKSGDWRWVECSLTNLLDDPEVGAILKNCRDKTEEVHLKEQQDKLIRQLEERNSFIENILENLPIGVAVNQVDDGKATTVNKRFAEIYGWDESDLADINSFFRNVYPDENYRNKIVKQVMDDIASRDPNRMKWDNIEVTTKTGDKRIINAKNIPLYDQNLMISTVIDVTQEYNQAEELRQTKSELDKIMNSSLDIICAVAPDGRILKINAAAEKLLGYTPDELKNTVIYDYVYKDDKERTIAEGLKVMEGFAARNFINRYVRKDGSVIPLAWSVQWDPHDHIRYCVASDATERLNYESALIESEKKYRQFFESNPLPVLIWDFKTLKIVDCNREAELKYGYTRDEFLKLTIKDIRPAEDIPLIEEAAKSVQSYGHIHRRVWRHKKKNGEIMYLDITGHLITMDGRKVSMALSMDVTENRYYMQLDKLEKDILEMHSDNSLNFNHIIKSYLEGIEAIHPGMLSSMQEKKGTRLFNIAAPGLPAAFLQAIEGAEIGVHAGSCGTAAHTKEKVIVSDIATDPRWKDYREVAVQNGLRSCWSYPIINSAGDVVATLASYYREIKLPTALEENTIQRAQHILQVILEGYERDKSLYKSNERFEYATQATSDVIWDWDLEDNSIYYSDNMTELFGHPSGINHNNLQFFYEHVHPDDQERIILYPDDVKYGSLNHITQEYRFKKADGQYAYVLDKGIVIRDKNGIGKRMVGAMRDITYRKNEEIQKALLSEAVTNTLREKNTILESIADAFFAVDNEWKVTYWNKIAERDLGKSRDDILGRNLWDGFADSLESVSYKNYHLAMATNQPVHFEDYYPPMLKWYEISAYPSVDGLSVYFKDITARKESEMQLVELNKNLEKQAKELMISNNELEQFAYVASHDLQEPLRMVTSFLSQIEKKYNAILDEKGRRYIHFAVDGAKRMRQIILDLLEFSRVGRIEEQLENVNLQDLVNEIKALYRKQIDEKKAKIVLQNLPVIWACRAPLRQVLQNLISNSLKYSIPGKPPLIVVTGTELDEYWQISVKDNGIGISPAYFDKIFIIFQRLHNKEEYSGNGMGLAITKKIVENLGGEIWVEAEEGNGSTFYFTIKKF